MLLLVVIVLSSTPLLMASCPADVLLMYQMLLHTEWSRQNFPKQYPEWRPPAQWSVVIGRSHNSSGVLWRIGELASDSVKRFVETGKADALLQEGASQKKGILSEFFAPPVPRGVGNTKTKFFVDAAHSKISMLCRIVPSPDWFVGVDSYDLCQDGKWTDSVTLDLDPTDGGTDNGFTFTSPKWATEPRANISRILSTFPDHPASSFFYPGRGELPRIAQVHLLKLKEFFLTKASREGLKPIGTIKKDSTRRKGIKRRPDLRSMKKGRSHSKRSRDCKVSEWSTWSDCSETCGFGEQKRVRTVTHAGGRPCPPLRETRWCRIADKCANGSYFRWN